MAGADRVEVSAAPVIDYEGSGYRQDFWEGQGREYEDAVERLALRRLMPPVGGRLAEIGAGFGRLADLYLGYEQVILFDYSRSLLQEAAQRWGGDERFVFVAGNLYELPLVSHTLDTLIMVRVMHHLADVPLALGQLRRVLHAQSVGVLEYANKRNAKSFLRWLLGRQSWSPLEEEPVEFVALNFDFHPGWMERQVQGAGLKIKECYAVSHFRLPFLKSRIDADRLAGMDGCLFRIGGRYPLAPSVLVQVEIAQRVRRAAVSTRPVDVTGLLRCPRCACEGLVRTAEETAECPRCERRFLRRGWVWDLKEASG